MKNKSYCFLLVTGPQDIQASVNITPLLTTGNNLDQFSQGQTVI